MKSDRYGCPSYIGPWELSGIILVAIFIGVIFIIECTDIVKEKKLYTVTKKTFVIDQVSSPSIYTINLIDPITQGKYEILFDTNTCRQASKTLLTKKEHEFTIKTILNKESNTTTVTFMDLSKDICGYE